MEIKWAKETKQTLRSIEETKLKEFEGQVMANIDLLHDYYANIQASFQRYGPPLLLLLTLMLIRTPAQYNRKDDLASTLMRTPSVRGKKGASTTAATQRLRAQQVFMLGTVAAAGGAAGGAGAGAVAGVEQPAQTSSTLPLAATAPTISSDTTTTTAAATFITAPTQTAASTRNPPVEPMETLPSTPAPVVEVPPKFPLTEAAFDKEVLILFFFFFWLDPHLRHCSTFTEHWLY